MKSETGVSDELASGNGGANSVPVKGFKEGKGFAVWMLRVGRGEAVVRFGLGWFGER